MDDQDGTSSRRTGGPQLFALIIGIDEYAAVQPQLKGAVADAKSMSTYIRERLHVPKGHIAELHNKSATREAIIQAFQDLRDDSLRDERIETGDAILIFYAGHGCEIDPPADWESDGQKIQGIVPYDAKLSDKNGPAVNVIPDRTIGALLSDISEKKGNNITVIFDCCHSASGTRGDVRGVDAEQLPPLPLEIDSGIIHRTRALKIPPGFAHSGTRSHIFLAACGAKEKAFEPHGRGAFTSALVSQLEKVDVSQLTYQELMDNLPKIQSQNPQCEGVYKNRILFSQLAWASRDTYQVEAVDGRLRLLAGLAQGVTEGVEFGIYQHCLDDEESNPRLATL
ncbi:hypothetical protein FRC06_004248, partial [Ceratobasidium sp. 370]